MSVETNTLESMCELIIDCPHSTPEWTDDGFIVTRNQNIKNGVLDLSSPSFTNKEDYLKRIKRASPQTGDIIFTREAPMGDVCLIPEGLQCCLGQRQVLLRPKDSVCGKYLFWALQSPFVQNQISWNEGTGSTVSNVRIPVLKALNIPRILGHEESIAKVLSDVADKIQLNRETNQTLEQVAQAIFKCWFVEFEPTRAKIAAKLNGQDPERAAMAAISGKSIEELEQLSPDTQQQLRTTAALFPDKLVDSELGEIPEGWDVGNIGSIVNAKGGYAFKGNSFVEEGNPVVKIKNITGDGRVDLKSTVCIDDEQAKKAERFKLSDGDLLMAMTGATVGKIGFVVTEGKSIYLNQRVAKFESEKFGKQISWFLYCCLQRDSIFDSVVGAAYGSAQPNISSSVIESIEFVVPHHDLIFNFCEFAESLFNKWISNINENSLLEESRDSLLPKLLSGELAMGEGE
jgi:type I restriction enzyme S subunit